jgi:hypothetical protein
MTDKQRTPGRRISALGASLLMALAFGAIAASGAQALDWQHQGGTTVLSGTSSETVAGTGSGFTITSKLLGASVEVNCSSATTNGSIVAGGTGSSTIGLGGCSVAKPSNCSLAYQPTLSAKVELVQVGGVLFQKFVPVGTSFGMIEFAGTKCVLDENKAPLKGSFAGRELSSALAANHSLSFAKSEPWPTVELKFGVEAATLTGEVTQHLSGNMANHGWRGIWQETHGGWETEGLPFTFPQSAIIAGGPVSFSFNILGAPVSFSCSNTSASEASLKPGGTETVKGLTFSGCKFEKPSNCALPGNQMQFESVTGTLTRVNGKVYEKFAASNPEGLLAVLRVEGSCGLAGNSYSVKGTFAGLGREFGAFKVFQPLEFSKAADEATGSQLTISGNGMTMAGSVQQELFSGTPWGAY